MTTAKTIMNGARMRSRIYGFEIRIWLRPKSTQKSSSSGEDRVMFLVGTRSQPLPHTQHVTHEL